MPIWSQRGAKTTNLLGDLLGYPNPVYYDPNRIANILSLSSVKHHHCVTYNSKGDNTFTVHKDHDDVMFREYAKGLYSHDTALHGETQS